MAAIERKTKRYPTDLTDEEWARIVPVLPKPARRGRKPSVDMREVLNAIRYEQRIDVSEAIIHVAMGSLLLRRITH